LEDLEGAEKALATARELWVDCHGFSREHRFHTEFKQRLNAAGINLLPMHSVFPQSH
jgi:hypothetical protein